MAPLPRSLSLRLVPGLLLSAFFLAGVPDPVSACATSRNPEPTCGKTLAFSLAMPGVVVLPGGGSFDVPSLLFFDLVDFPPGAGVCPNGPYSATVSLTATCDPSPGGSGMVTVPITKGYNEITVPVTLGAGSPRLCSITGTATVALADGSTLAETGKAVVCTAEPVPGNPALPRLDMQILGPAGSEIARAHAGDQSSYVYRITNNDPVRTFSGELTIEMVNSSRMPQFTGVNPNEAFSVSDPVEGDNFRIGFDRDLYQGCLDLPADPTNPAIPTLMESIDLAPGETIDVDFHTRPWGTCANGSCGEGKLVLDGLFSDLTPGLACAGVVVAVDDSVAPEYECPDSGQAVQAVDDPSAPPNRITVAGAPDPSSEVSIDFETSQAVLEVGGLASGAFTQFESAATDRERGRTRVRFLAAVPWDAFDTFDISTEVLIQPSAGQLSEAELRRIVVILGAPTGFEDIAPFGKGMIAMRPQGSSEPDRYLSFHYQLSAAAIDELGARRDIHFNSIAVIPKTNGSGFDVLLGDGTVEPGAGFVIDLIELSQDLLGFTSPQPQSKLGEIFSNGFESGDTSAWTFVAGGGESEPKLSPIKE